MPRDVVTTPIGAVRLGESVRARSGAIGRIVRIVSFRDLDAAARRALRSKRAAPADDDFVFVELYAKGKAQRGPARLDLTREQVAVPVCEVEAVVLVVHEDHDVSLPLEGVVDAFLVDRVGRKRVHASAWPSVPEGSLTHLTWGLRVQLRACVFGILSEKGGGDKKDGCGYSAATIGMTNADFAIVSRLFDATGAPPTARRSTTGKISWAMRPSDVTFVKRGQTSSATTLSFVTRAQLAGVDRVLGRLWNVGVNSETLNSRQRMEVGLEDPLRAGDETRSVNWSLHVVVPPEEEEEEDDDDDEGEDSSGEDSSGEDTEADAPEPTKQSRGARKRRRPEGDDAASRKPKPPSKAVMSWVGQYFTDDGMVWRVTNIDIVEDRVPLEYGVFTERVVPPPPADQDAAAAAGDESFWNWAGIPMFRASFADKLRKRATKHARAPRTPGLRLRYVSGACGRGTLTVGVYWRSMPASALGGRALPRLLAD